MHPAYLMPPYHRGTAPGPSPSRHALTRPWSSWLVWDRMWSSMRTLALAIFLARRQTKRFERSRSVPGDPGRPHHRPRC